MGWTKIASFKNDANYVASPTITGPVNVTVSGIAVGDLLIVSTQIGLHNVVSTVTVTDNAGTPNTYSAETNAYDTVDNQGIARHSAPVASATGLTTVTASWTGTGENFISVLVEQWRHTNGPISGTVINGTPKSQYQAAPGTGANAITSTATTTTVNGCLVHSTVVFGNSTPTTTTVGTGFASSVDDLASAQVATEQQTQAASGAIAGTWTEGSAQPSIATVTAYAPPAAGGNTLTPSSIPNAPVGEDSVGIQLGVDPQNVPVGVRNATLSSPGVLVPVTPSNVPMKVNNATLVSFALVPTLKPNAPLKVNAGALSTGSAAGGIPVLRHQDYSSC